ncbi:Uncharacterised protein [uncultured archaeon]|nr:Uncharacterised protein [uncultured archaeon]
MRLTWDEQNSYFLAELTPGDKWREDMETVKAAGFKTTGPPSWQWYAQKAAPLNKLRENRPSSGLTLTELALQKYQDINSKEEAKAALKAQLVLARKEAEKQVKKELKCKDDNEYYFDEDIQCRCIVVRPAETPSVSKFVRPEPPKETCMICDDPLYLYESKNICIWCEHELEKQKL